MTFLEHYDHLMQKKAPLESSRAPRLARARIAFFTV